MYKKILVPLDGSKQSEGVLPLISMLAKSNQAEIVLLRVVEYPYTLYSNVYEDSALDPDLMKKIQDEKDSIYSEVEGYLEKVMAKLVSTGVEVTIEVCEGPIVESIFESTNRLQADLIALAMCSQSKCTRCIMGSIASRVLHESPVTVIMVRHQAIIPGAILEHYTPLQDRQTFA
ncbi:MAG: universal stress protein [Chloroflexota bacterium]